MNRLEFIEYLGPLRQGIPVIASPGLQGGLLASTGEEPMTIYGMDMFYATPMALGVALGWPSQKVVALDSTSAIFPSVSVA
jgi:hypothetical protein